MAVTKCAWCNSRDGRPVKFGICELCEEELEAATEPRDGHPAGWYSDQAKQARLRERLRSREEGEW